MRTKLLLILYLIGNVHAEKPPDVNCTVIHLKYIECLWESSDVNYTFYSRFFQNPYRECPTYLVKDGLNTGCNQPEDELKSTRFNRFETKLKLGEENYTKRHDLKGKVKLYPPTNLTVQIRSDSSLWLKWIQIFTDCVESEVRCRVNQGQWEVQPVQEGYQEYRINTPSNTSRYELQVRSRVSDYCSLSMWSDWSESVIWGPTVKPTAESLGVWTVILFCVGGATLLLLLVALLHHERIRIILVPVVPKPSLVHHDFQGWLNSSKGLQDVFKTSFQENTCSVCEPCPDYDNSDSSSISSNQNNCSDPLPNPDHKQPEEQHMLE